MKRRKKASLDGAGIEELNLTEFPLALLAHRSDPSQKTIRFEDDITDRSTGTTVHRSVIVTGSDEWGLPTAKDMDVLLALMMLTETRHGFRERRVEFTLGEVRQLLKWPKNGNSLRRLKLSFDRWLGVTVKFENAWRRRDKWTSLKGFHVIDNVNLTHGAGANDDSEPQLFKWNDVIVESFQNRYTKGLDWAFYIGLNSTITKRLYRFLDKRFGVRPNWPPADIRHFCVNKLGMADGWRASDYKKKLLPAIVELEAANFLRPMPTSERFKAPRRGRYNVVFEPAKPKRKEAVQKATPTSPLDDVEAAIFARGCTNAKQMVATYPSERIRRAIENFDDRNKHGEGLGPGWLANAIRAEQEFGFRKGYKSSEHRQAEDEQKAQRKKAAAQKTKHQLEEAAEHKKERQARTKLFQEYVSGLSQHEVDNLELEAIDKAKASGQSFRANQVLRARKQGQEILEAGALRQDFWFDFIISEPTGSP